MQFLSSVEESFQIKGGGCVINFQILTDAIPLCRKGAIRLIKADGAVLDTEVEELEIMRRGRLEKNGKECIGFLLPKPLAKSDVPRGTEIWLLNE